MKYTLRIKVLLLMLFGSTLIIFKNTFWVFAISYLAMIFFAIPNTKSRKVRR